MIDTTAFVLLVFVLILVVKDNFTKVKKKRLYFIGDTIEWK